MSILSEIGSSTLLFILIFGMSATVDIGNLRKQLRNRNAIVTGILLQFVLFPFLGFAVVKALDLSAAEGITLLVVTSSPGGSYSNWWCSLFNADLALSVTMTAISTFMSILFLPMNLIIYARGSYEADVIHNVDWVSLFTSLGIVITAIGLGLFTSASVHSPKFNIYANKLGSVAGLALVVYSIMISRNSEESLWHRDWKFYLGVASPCVLGLAAANMISTYFGLKKPERVTVSVECCYQNVGIATSVAITMFKGEELSQAVGVPLFYGLVEAVVLGFYCITAWKVGWTKAPPKDSFCVVIGKSYEVELTQVFDLNAIEVVLGSPKEQGADDNDILFELDHSTSSITDSERENGSIYGISYPTSKQKNSQIETDGGPKDHIHQRSVLFSIPASPEITNMRKDLSGMDLNVIQDQYDYPDFLKKDIEIGDDHNEVNSCSNLNSTNVEHTNQNIHDSPTNSTNSTSFHSQFSHSESNSTFTSISTNDASQHPQQPCSSSPDLGLTSSNQPPSSSIGIVAKSDKLLLPETRSCPSQKHDTTAILDNSHHSQNFISESNTTRISSQDSSKMGLPPPPPPSHPPSSRLETEELKNAEIPKHVSNPSNTASSSSASLSSSSCNPGSNTNLTL